MSFFGWTRYVANIVDENFEIVASVIIGRSMGFKGLKKLSFDYAGGTYNIVPSAFVVKPATKALFFNNVVYIYQIGNPNPFKFQSNQFKPIMDAEVYRVRLKNKLVVDLNSAALGSMDIKKILGFLALGVVAFLIVMYFLNKNSAVSAEVANTTVQTVRPAIATIGGGIS